MSLRRFAAIVLAAAVALLAAAVLYLAFGDLSRHKGRIEYLVTGLLGRRFAIDGAFKLQVLPSIAVSAERIRLANAERGSQPQMVEIGRLSVRVGLWSLLRGPVDVRSLEAGEVSVLLEKDADGKGNWVFGKASAPGQEAASPGSNASGVPAVLQHAKLDNVRITYRDRGKPDFTALVETLSIDPGAGGLLAIAGRGKLNQLAAAVTGELGPMEALFSGRNLRLAIQASLGDLRLDANGALGRLDPLAGADLTVKARHPDLGAMLTKLGLPAVASGALTADARLKDSGGPARLELAAKLGDITVKADGTLRVLGLPGSDLRFEAVLADVRRVAAVLGVTGVPAGALELGGRVTSSGAEIGLDGISARFAGAKARVDGTVRTARGGSAELRFALAAGSLARLREGLPEVALSMNGIFAGNPDKVEVKSLKGRIGKSEITARASMVRTGKKRVDIELASPRLDLTPISGERAGAKAEARAKPPERKFVFAETPLPLGELKVIDTRLRFASAEVRLGTVTLRDVESTLLVEGGRLSFEGRARGGREGTVNAAVKLAPAGGGAAALDLTVSAKNVRAGLGAGDAVDPGEEPPMNLEATLLAQGASARQMASGASGKVLVTQGPGKLESGLPDMVGSGILAELAGKLNPFSAQDPYTHLDCTVARVDIVDGRANIRPVLVQTRKVTIVASGSIDLATEALTLGFDTRPRTGIGISAGMFTNPFIELAGTLASPKLGVGTKGATAGAAAAATGGATVLAQGLADRVRGSEDLCKKTLEEAAASAN